MQSSTVVGVLMRQRLHHLLSAKLTILWPFLPFASFSSSSAANDARYIRTPTVPFYSLLPHAGFQREDKSHKVSAACSCPLFSTSTSLFRPCSLARGVLLSARLPGIGASSALTFFIRNYSLRVTKVKKGDFDDEHSQRAVTTALWCNFLVFSLKSGVWLATSSHVMLAEVVHSIADFANQPLLAYGLNSSRRAPDAMHPYGYSKERFVWSLISAVGIFCIGSGATIVHGFQNLWTSQCPENIYYATLVIGGSFLIEGASLTVAITAVKKGAAAEGMKVWDYIWRGHDPTSVAVMTEDGAAVTGLAIAAASLMAVNKTGNAIYDPIGSIIVGNLLGMVAIFLIQKNRHALIGRAMDDNDMEKVLQFLKSDPVVDAIYDCKSEVIGPGFFRFKPEIDFNGVVVVQNYLERTRKEEWARKHMQSTTRLIGGKLTLSSR